MTEPLPLAVVNLRRIWDQRKRELAITQVEAAKELGWTQGALSQYLNNITELNDAAIIKLAAYLDVTATDIDPTITDRLPGTSKVAIRHHFPETRSLKERSILLPFFVHPNAFVISSPEQISIPVKNREKAPIASLDAGTKVLCVNSKDVHEWLDSTATCISHHLCLIQKNGSAKTFSLERLSRQELLRLDPSNYKKHYTVIATLFV